MTVSTSICAGTPTVSVFDNRSLPVRALQFCRSQVGEAADLRVTCTTFSAAGRATSQADPRLGAAGLANVSQRFGLADAALHYTGADDGQRWAFTDILGRLRWQQDGAGTTSTYRHDALGRPLSISCIQGSLSVVQERFYYGDTISPALLPRERAQTANLRGQAVYTWDNAGQHANAAISLTGVAVATSRRLLHKLDSQPDWTGDDADPATWQAWEAALDQAVYRTTLTLNAQANVLTHTDAAGHVRRQAYDVGGRPHRQWLTLATQAEQAILLEQTYNAAGLPLTQTQGNGVTQCWNYEAQTQRLIGATVTRLRAGVTQRLQALCYSHDPVGNVLSVTDTAQATTWFRNQQVSPVSTFSYDSLYQLLVATGREAASQKRQTTTLPTLLTPLPADSCQYTAYTRTFTYDRGGNLTQLRHSAPKTGNQWTRDIVMSATSNHGVASDLFTGITPVQVDVLFDSAGNQLQLQAGQALNWDTRRRLRQVSSGAALREYYGYAGANRVVKVSEQTVSGTVQQQRVVYLDGLELRTCQQGDSTVEALQVLSLPGSNVQVLHWTTGKPAAVANDGIRYRYANHLGSLQLELDQQGDIISREEYYPYGGTALWAARNQTEATYKTRRFSGKERDASGLYYFGQRYYQPWAGRWLSADPAGAVDGPNLYAMVRNNPVSNRDDDGLSITIGKDKYKTDAAFKKSALYKTLGASQPPATLDRLISHYNAVDEVFLSEAHFTDLLRHDINTHLASDTLDANQTAQKDYLTRAGWHGRLKATRPTDFSATQRPQAFWKGYAFAAPGNPLGQVDAALASLNSTAEISLYRTLPHAEAQALLGEKNYDALGKHLGDFAQALSYFHRDGNDKALLEFPLKPGAHEALFTPAFSAVLDSGNVTSVMARLADLNGAGRYAKAKKGEGSLAGYIGIKPEEHGVSGFSLSIGDRDSRELFMRFVQVDKVREVLRR
jgi:insecticidal toxin complex protein TccC